MSPSHPTPSRPRRIARLLLPPLLLLGTALAVPPTALADPGATPTPSATSGDPRPSGEDTAPAARAEDPAPDPATVTTADRTDDLAPEGDQVTVAGAGYPAGATVAVETWVMSAGESAATGSGTDATELPGTADEDNAVTVEVDGRGAFHTQLDVNAEFAAEAGLDAEDGVFEIRVTPDDTAPAASPPAGGPPGSTRAAVPALAAPAGVARIPVGFAPAAATAPAAQPQPLTQPGQRPETTSRSQPGAPAPMDPDSATGSGGQRLEVSKTTGLNPDGEEVTVTGSGYDTSKGVYVALCDISSASGSRAPSPCVGGVDMDGDSGSSVWVSSNPPPYGQGLAEPYSGSGTNGGFTVQLTVRAQDQFTDCLSNGVECAVVTRNDHTRSSDRGQDVFVPVRFTGQSGSGGDSGNSSNSGSGNNDTSSGGSGESGGSGNTGNSGSRGDTGSSGSLPRTGSALAGLIVAAVTATALGAAAMAAARRRRSAPADASPT